MSVRDWWGLPAHERQRLEAMTDWRESAEFPAEDTVFGLEEIPELNEGDVMAATIQETVPTDGTPPKSSRFWLYQTRWNCPVPTRRGFAALCGILSIIGIGLLLVVSVQGAPKWPPQECVTKESAR